MSARILVVDDVEVNVKLLDAKLSAEYFDVMTATSGADALRLCAVETPDLILLDVMMPQMDGFEVCRRLKADPRTTDVPVVMVTALSDASDRLRGLEAGADDFLSKPVNDIALFARVRSLVRLRRMMEELRIREDVCGRFAFGEAGGGVRDDGCKGHIMLVDDNPYTSARMAEDLAPIADEFIRTTSTAEAASCLDARIELVVMSLALSQDDPLRLVSKWRANEQTRQVPILLVADESELPRLAKGLDLGANDYILRPIERNELSARARTQIRRKRMQDRLSDNYQRSLSMALTDPLTGLYNRRYVNAHLEEALDPVSPGGFAVLMFDIDWFKQVNDTYGHPAGDEVLREVAVRTLRSVRNFDLVARYGGEEFLVLMPETGMRNAYMVAERLRLAIAEQLFHLSGNDKDITVTISVGAAIAREGDTSALLVKRVDEALYAAKNDGRNRTVCIPPADTADEEASEEI